MSTLLIYTYTYPIVRKVLVYDLSHLGLLRVENVGSKEKDDIEHTSLSG